MASGYKECYYYYNLLSKALDISSGLYDISNKSFGIYMKYGAT